VALRDEKSGRQREGHLIDPNQNEKGDSDAASVWKEAPTLDFKQRGGSRMEGIKGKNGGIRLLDGMEKNSLEWVARLHTQGEYESLP